VNCPKCGKPMHGIPPYDPRDCFDWKCPYCGKFVLGNLTKLVHMGKEFV